MIFKSFLSYVLGVVCGIISVSAYVNGDVLTLWISIAITFIVSQILSLSIKKHMKNKYLRRLHG